jgi:hypothetical protein
MAMRMLGSLAAITMLAGCASRGPIVHPEGERFDPPPETPAPPVPPPGPRPPAVSVAMVFAPSLSPTLARSSESLLDSLDGDYLSIATGKMDASAVSSCLVRASAAIGCVQDLLTAGNAAKGTVVIMVSSLGRGTVGWTCVGRPVEQFDAGHQQINWSHDDAPTAPPQTWPRSVQGVAASCITYAGRQGGW